MPTVRRAETRDADAALALLEGLGRPEVAEDPSAQRTVFVDHLGYDDATVFVAEEAGAVVGIASLWLRPRLNWATLEAWVPDLFVDPAYRRLGVGRALLEACAAEAPRRGCHRLGDDSAQDGTEARLLYEALGFVEADRQYVLVL